MASEVPVPSHRDRLPSRRLVLIGGRGIGSQNFHGAGAQEDQFGASALSQSTVVPTPNNIVGTIRSPEVVDMTQGDSDDGQQSEVLEQDPIPLLAPSSHGEVPLEEATTESLCSGVSDADADAEDEFLEVPLPEVEVPVVEVTITREFRAALQSLSGRPHFG